MAVAWQEIIRPALVCRRAVLPWHLRLACRWCFCQYWRRWWRHVYGLGIRKRRLYYLTNLKAKQTWKIARILHTLATPEDFNQTFNHRALSMRTFREHRPPDKNIRGALYRSRRHTEPMRCTWSVTQLMQSTAMTLHFTVQTSQKHLRICMSFQMLEKSSHQGLRFISTQGAKNMYKTAYG